MAIAPIHATNAWNPTGCNLSPVAGTRLYFAHAETLSGPRTFVLLGDQQHLTFVADLAEHVAADAIRAAVVGCCGLYQHQVDLEPTPGLPRPIDDNPRVR